MPKIKIKAFDNKVEIVESKLNENGYLVIKCIFARTGIQERYGSEISEDFDQTKLYKEYRSPDEVFKSEVIQAFQNVVITNDHPTELLTTQNTKYHAVGFVSSKVEIIDNKYLQCDITIYDDVAIADIQNGKVELSAGYLYSILVVENPQYDYIQTDIKPNHIALVQAGRCGKSCSLALDNQKPNSKKGVKVKVIFKRMKSDGTDEVIAEIEIADEVIAKEVQTVADKLYDKSKSMVELSNAKDEEVESLKEDATKKDDELEDVKKANDKLQAQIDTKKPVAMDDAKLQKLAMDLVAVMMVARDSGIECQGLDALSIQKEVIKKHNPDLALDGKSPEYIGFAFDSVALQLKGADSSYTQAMNIKPSKALDDEAKKINDSKSAFDKKYGGDL
jgi:hypothetical protein